MSDFTLTPIIASVIFAISCLCGHHYRSVWKAEGPRWKLWVFGGIAAAGLVILAFVPLQPGS